MKFQDISFNGLKVTVGTKSVTHTLNHPSQSKTNMPHQLFQSWGHKGVGRGGGGVLSGGGVGGGG